MTRYLILIVLTFKTQSSFSQSQYIPLQTIEIDLDQDNKKDTIRLSTIKDWNDPGMIHKIEIECSKIGLTEIDVADSYYEDFTRTKFGKDHSDLNLVDSEYLFITTTNDATYLLLFGYSFASSPGMLSIFRFGEKDMRRIYHENFAPHELKSLSNSIRLVGRQFFEEIYGINVDGYEKRTYAPYTVYTIGEKVEIDLNQTEEYNVQKYAGFLGLGYGSPHAVLTTRGKKPKLLLTTYRKYPQATIRRLHKSELSSYSADELRIMRNEIFAEYGYMFKSDDLKVYFDGQDWYEPRLTDVSDKLTEIEKSNVRLILEVEKSKR